MKLTPPEAPVALPPTGGDHMRPGKAGSVRSLGNTIHPDEDSMSIYINKNTKVITQGITGDRKSVV